MHNPIINNRIIYDYTFAHKLKKFISTVGHKYGAADYDVATSWGYLNNVAEILLKYQVATVDKTNADEMDYLTRCAGQEIPK